MKSKILDKLNEEPKYIIIKKNYKILDPQKSDNISYFVGTEVELEEILLANYRGPEMDENGNMHVKYYLKITPKRYTAEQLSQIEVAKQQFKDIIKDIEKNPTSNHKFRLTIDTEEYILTREQLAKAGINPYNNQFFVDLGIEVLKSEDFFKVTIDIAKDDILKLRKVFSSVLKVKDDKNDAR